MAFQDAAALQPYWAGYLAELLLERGELAEAQRLVERPPPALAQRGHFLNFFRVRGLVAFRAGSPEQALTDFRAAGDLARSLRIENPAFAPWRSEAALALHRLDRWEEARELAHEELELSRRWGAARTIGISLRALGLVEGGQTGERRCGRPSMSWPTRPLGSSTRVRSSTWVPLCGVATAAARPGSYCVRGSSSRTGAVQPRS